MLHREVTMKELIDSQKGQALKVLSALKKIDKDAIIAGGAPRDWYFKRGAKDLDCYFFLDRKTLCEFDYITEGALESVGFKVIEEKGGYRYKGDNPDLMQVFDVSMEGVGMPIQLMRWSSPLQNVNEVLNTFATSLSCIYFDGEIHTTEVFDVGYKYNSSIKLSGSNSNQTIKYMKKIKDKYPDMHHFDSWKDYNIWLVNGGLNGNIHPQISMSKM